MSAQNDMPQPPKRPLPVWFLCLYFFIVAGWGTLFYGLMLTGAIELDPAQKQYIPFNSRIEALLMTLLAVLNLAGAVMLFMLKKRAFPLFVVALFVNVLIHLCHVVIHDMQTATKANPVIMVTSWIFAAGVAFYVKHLAHRNILK